MRGGRNRGKQRLDSHPPRCRLVIRVGVTGHRPKDLSDADIPVLEQRIGWVLDVIAEIAHEIAARTDSGYAEGGPLLRIVSSVAEGSDRMVAQEGAKRHWELHCPLPFPRQEYENDFPQPESKTEFRTLLKRAGRVFELDGSRSSPQREAESYERVGRMVLRHCDVLIAIWSGEPANGIGGTAQMTDEAVVRFNLPTVWIRARRPHEITIRTYEGDGQFGNKELTALVGMLKKTFLLQGERKEKKPVFHILESLIAPSSQSSMDIRHAYFLEKARKWNKGFPFQVFSNVAGTLRPGRVSLRLPPVDLKGHEAAMHGRGLDVRNAIRRHYAWADNLAVYFANLYRTSFLLNYVFAALAVCCALLPLICHCCERGFTVAELALIIAIIVLTVKGNLGSWHAKWLYYRLLAEVLRCHLYLAPLGRSTPSSPSLVQAGKHPGAAWVQWHSRAIFREAGMPSAIADDDYCRACLHEVDCDVKGQIRYHRKNAQRLHEIHTHLHLLGIVFFFLTLLACCLHLRFSAPVVTEFLVVCAAVFPTAGAAVAGILSQAEFRVHSERSTATYQKIAALKRVTFQASKTSSLELAGNHAERAAEAMLSELIGWHSLSERKFLGLPS